MSQKQMVGDWSCSVLPSGVRQAVKVDSDGSADAVRLQPNGALVISMFSTTVIPPAVVRWLVEKP